MENIDEIVKELVLKTIDKTGISVDNRSVEYADKVAEMYKVIYEKLKDIK